MKRATIVGAGRMGLAVAYGLAKLGYYPVLVDSSLVALDNAWRQLNKLGVECKIHHNNGDFGYNFESDVVVSCCTFTANYNIACSALKKDIPYVDLGGDPQTSKNIKNVHNPKNTRIFTDSGLAPGLVNIIAENLCDERIKQGKGPPHTILMRVGGLPRNPKGHLQYALTWSAEGLYNQYKGECNILKDGEETTVPALSGADWCYVQSNGISSGNLRSFHTKGGSAHSIKSFKEKGVKNVEYRTIRSPGHRSLVDFLINDCKMTDKEFADVFNRAAPPTKEDLVLVQVEMDFDTKDVIIKHDANWTAMQKATAFPTAAIADYIVSNGAVLKGGVLSYSDIPLEAIASRTKKIDNNFII